MQKLLSVSLFFLVVSALQPKALATTTLNCRFKNTPVENVKTIKIVNDSLFINGDTEIPLDKSVVKCGNFGRQSRFDGNAMGYQVILKTCTTDATMEGYLLDSIRVASAAVLCDQI